MGKMEEWAFNVSRGESRTPRPINEHEMHSFKEATYETPTRRTREALIRYARSANLYRYNRLKKDFKWLQGELESIGVNPEDARFII